MRCANRRDRPTLSRIPISRRTGGDGTRGSRSTTGDGAAWRYGSDAADEVCAATFSPTATAEHAEAIAAGIDPQGHILGERRRGTGSGSVARCMRAIPCPPRADIPEPPDMKALLSESACSTAPTPFHRIGRNSRRSMRTRNPRCHGRSGHGDNAGAISPSAAWRCRRDTSPVNLRPTSPRENRLDRCTPSAWGSGIRNQASPRLINVIAAGLSADARGDFSHRFDAALPSGFGMSIFLVIGFRADARNISSAFHTSLTSTPP